uniref:Ig-like domain-containing protein n=1 Tax=Leptobrachium leishanense TaxID=445787 RepID=A0A8C5R245_9ANUR
MNVFLLSTFTIVCYTLVIFQPAFCALPTPILLLITNDTEDVIVTGDDISFVCSSTFPDSERFKLFRGSQMILEQSDPTFNLLEVTIDVSGSYTCQNCYQSTCSEPSEPEIIYVQDTFPSPMITVTPRTIVLPRERVIVTCSTTRSDIMFLFYKDNTLVKEDIIGGNQSTYEIESASEKDADYYRCIYKAKPGSKYQIASTISNPLRIQVKDLPRPSISFGVDGYEGRKMNIHCTSPYQHGKSVWFQLLDGNKTLVSETRAEHTNATFTIERPLHSKRKYYCVYHIRMGQDFAYSQISDHIIIGDGTDFTRGNTIRLLLSVLILVVAGVFIWKHCNCFQKTDTSHTLPVTADSLDLYTEEPHAVYKSDPEECTVLLETNSLNLADISLCD